MFQIDAMSRVPVYEQIVKQTEEFILAGIFKGGDWMPSVRSLSVQLSVNPNTIQKAYNELDNRGIIQSVPGKGCAVCTDAKEILCRKKAEDLMNLSALLSEFVLAGIAKERVLEMVESIYASSEKGKDDEK